VPFAGLVIVGVTITLGYILLGQRCQSIAGELKALEQRGEELRRENRQHVFKWTQMKSPQHLEASIYEYGIHMTWPSSHQVVSFSRVEMLNRAIDQHSRNQLAQVRRSVRNDY